MAKYGDEVELLLSARDEQIAAVRQADARVRELAQKQDGLAREQIGRARELAEAEAKILDTQLRRSGEVLEADLQQIKRYYNAKVRAALDVNDLELADRLATLREIREAEAREDDAARRRLQEESRGGRFDKFLRGGVGQAATFAAAIKGAEGFTEALVEARNAELGLIDTTELLVERTLKSVPILSNAFDLGQGIRELITGERAAAREAELRARFEGEVLDKIKQSRDVTRALQNERDVLALQDDRERQHLAFVLQQQEDIRAARIKFNQAVMDYPGTALSSELASELQITKEIAKVRRAAFELDQFKARAAEDDERLRAVHAVEDEITDIRLRSLGKIHEAELAANKNDFQARVTAAREAGNEELADRLRTLEALKRAEIEKAEEVRQRIDEINQQRLEAREEIELRRDQLTRARSRSTSIGSPTADQDRYLTGLRQQNDADARALRDREQKQIKLLEDQVKAAKEALDKLKEIAESLRNGALVVPGDL